MAPPIIAINSEASRLEQIEHYGGKNPAPAVLSVSDKVLTVKPPHVHLRNQWLLPWLLGISIGIFGFVDSYYKAWKAAESSDLRYVTGRMKAIPDYFDRGDNPVAAKIYNRVSSGYMPFKTYVYYRYNDIAYPERRLRGDIIFGSLLSIAFILLLYFNITFKRRAPLFFDRDKCIVYSWHKGKAWAQRYDKLDYWYNYQALYIRMRLPFKKDVLGWCRFAVQPTGINLYGGGKDVYETVLSCIVKFMADGREAVWHEDWQAKDNFFFFDDKKPKDFETQLEAILLEIDSETEAA